MIQHLPSLTSQPRKRGASLLGYGLIVGLIGVVAILSITSVGDVTNSIFTRVGGEIDGVAGASGQQGFALNGISPAAGLDNTGTVVTLSGSGFAGPVSVTFGGQAGSSVSVDSASQITVTTPTSLSGQTVDVVVTQGSESATLSQAFTFATPAGTGFCTSNPPSLGEIGCDPGDGTIFAGLRFTSQADRDDDGQGSGARIFVMPNDSGNLLWTSAQNNNDANPAPCINGSADCFAPDEATILGDGIGNPAFEACYCLGETAVDSDAGNNPAVCSGQPGAVLNGGQGHNDWFLPSIAEIDVVYVNLIVGSGSDVDNPQTQYGTNGGTTSPSSPQGIINMSGQYWSSSERRRNDDAWQIFANSGQIYFSNGNATKNVRCIRTE